MVLQYRSYNHSTCYYEPNNYRPTSKLKML